LVGKSLLPRLSAARRSQLEDRLAGLTPSQPTWVEQKPAITPMGKKTWQEWVTRGFFDEAGRLVELQSLGRDITLEKELSLAMDEIARSLLTIRGGRYFEHMVRHLSRVLEADACYVGELVTTEAGVQRFRFLGLSVDGALETLPEVALPGTPLEKVFAEGFFSMGSGVRRRFPKAPLLRRVGAESYVAAAMRDHDGTILGAVGVLYRQPMAETNFYTGAVVGLTASVGASRLLQARESRRREILERQLRESQKMEAIGQLAGGVAHDFNNLLTVLSGHAALLQSLPLPVEAMESVREIAEGTARAAALTRQLLMFSRRQVMQFGVHDLNAVVRGFSRLLQRLTPEHIHLVLDLHPDPLPVEADPGMLEQVLLNLAVNARDAMPQGGTLTLTTRPQEASPETALTALPTARLTVSDTGHGIDPEHLGRIFEPFFTTKPPGEGTGIGLATVYSIVGQHQGHLKTESQLGQGTTFHVHLPLLPSLCEGNEGLGVPGVEPEMPDLPGRIGDTVLVVEDEAPLRMLVRRLLEKQGFRVVEAASGRRAMEFSIEDVRAARLLITDLVMPEGMNGWETAERLRARNPSLRVIYTSGYDAGTAGQAVSMAPGSSFLQKPWQCAELAGNVRAILEN
jgi:signal transduction histidine kinase